MSLLRDLWILWKDCKSWKPNSGCEHIFPVHSLDNRSLLDNRSVADVERKQCLFSVFCSIAGEDAKNKLLISVCYAFKIGLWVIKNSNQTQQCRLLVSPSD